MLYKLFKNIFRKQLQEEIWGILGWHEFVSGEDSWGSGTSMSWETFCNSLFD